MDLNTLIEQLRKAADREVHRVDVPEWGVTLYVRAMSGRDRDWFDMALTSEDRSEKIGIRARVIAKCLCTETGERYPYSEDLVDALAERNAAVLSRIFDFICKISGIGSDAAADAKKN
ncbi:MAG: hypothetical protein KatS3mg038_2570 [Candidatus Kapaibacterium sp.]|nr:MAG: hypothetical protein KatS3mg038_2570 [Candidatus Kapabacteria bacterium]